MMHDELIVDSFAGGGGASLGIAWAIGRAPDVAINHDPSALAMHEANHPSTRHVCEDVWHANLRELVDGQDVGLLWASPDCKHFSRAKGSVPVNKSIRSLAWVVVRWASQVRPRVIMLENVREFADWGPLVPRWECRCGWLGTEGQAKLVRKRRRCPRCESLRLRITPDLVPDPRKLGTTFRLFVNRLRGMGYRVEWRHLDAADFGAPTHRRRLFLIARCDGASIVWPEPTHGDPAKLDAHPLFDSWTPKVKPWRTAAECIDWSIPCPSIFDRKRPLAEKTMRRIAMGIKRYVLDAAEPFIVGVGGRASQSPATGADDPLGTVTAKNDRALVTPVLVSTNHGDSGGRRSYPLDEPTRTVQASARGSEALVAPILTKYHHAKAGESRCRPVDEPVNTLDTQNRFGLVAATLAQTGYGERDGQAPRAIDIDKPLGTVVAGGAKHALVAAFMAKHFGGMVGVPIDTPLPTTTTIATQNNPVAVNLVRMNHGDKQWNDVREPLVTVTSQGNKNGVVATNLIRFNHDDAGVPIDEPLPTITQTNHAALVYSFLVRYFGTAIGQHVMEPLFTITGKDRFGLVTVLIAGEVYYIADIGMRMLTPRELARAQGFPDTYELSGTKTSQVAKIGNSVCPPVVKALVESNYVMEVVCT